MNELQALTAQRDKLLENIREIEASCEGIENENNAQRVQELNLEQAKLNAQKQEISEKLSAMNSRLSAISSEIANLSGTGIDRILEAIKKQRWYFFKNKTKVIMDKDTGLLWADLHYYDRETLKIAKSKIDLSIYNTSNINDWKIPDYNQFRKMIEDKTFPLHGGGDHWELGIKNQLDSAYWPWYIVDNTTIKIIDLSDLKITDRNDASLLLPFSDKFVLGTDYEDNVSPNNPNYTEKERLQFTLDLFTQNDLWPIFDDAEITELYKKIYYEKPRLIEQLQELQAQIESLQTVVLLSSQFDYTALLAKYDIKSIDSSVIKYYQEVQQWTEELMEKLDYYEKEKKDVIRDLNTVTSSLSKKYEPDENLTDEENSLLGDRHSYFANRFSLDMDSVKSKILSVKRQADELESRIDEIDNSDDSIHQLALLEKEERASFSFIAENTAKIVRNALKKIEFFEANHQYVEWAVSALEQWTEKYKSLKTAYFEETTKFCEENGIADEEILSKILEGLCHLQFSIEQKFQSIVAYELNGRIEMIEEDEISVAQQVIAELEVYRNSADKFNHEEYFNGLAGNFQHNGVSKTVADVYNFFFCDCVAVDDEDNVDDDYLKESASNFQNALQGIISNCAKEKDRNFILNWAKDLIWKLLDE